MPEYPYNGVMTPLLPAFSNFTIYDLSVDPFENENLLGKLPPETFIELVIKFFVRSTLSRFRHSIMCCYVFLVGICNPNWYRRALPTDPLHSGYHDQIGSAQNRLLQLGRNKKSIGKHKELN